MDIYILHNEGEKVPLLIHTIVLTSVLVVIHINTPVQTEPKSLQFGQVGDLPDHLLCCDHLIMNTRNPSCINDQQSTTAITHISTATTTTTKTETTIETTTIETITTTETTTTETTTTEKRNSNTKKRNNNNRNNNNRNNNNRNNNNRNNNNRNNNNRNNNNRNNNNRNNNNKNKQQ